MDRESATKRSTFKSCGMSLALRTGKLRERRWTIVERGIGFASF